MSFILYLIFYISYCISWLLRIATAHAYTIRACIRTQYVSSARAADTKRLVSLPLSLSVWDNVLSVARACMWKLRRDRHENGRLELQGVGLAIQKNEIAFSHWSIGNGATSIYRQTAIPLRNIDTTRYEKLIEAKNCHFLSVYSSNYCVETLNVNNNLNQC